MAVTFVPRTEQKGQRAAEHLRKLFHSYQKLRSDLAVLRADVALSAIVCDKGSLQRPLGDLNFIDTSLVTSMDALAESLSEVTIEIEPPAPVAVAPSKLLEAMVSGGEPVPKPPKIDVSGSPANALKDMLKKLNPPTSAKPNEDQASGGSLPAT